MNAIPLDVCLNNGRHHVEVLQIIASAAGLVAGRGEGGSLQSFGIHRITGNKVSAIFDRENDGPSDHPVIAEALFAGGAGPVGVSFIEMPDRAPEATLPETVTYEFMSEHAPLSATYRFAGVHGFGDLLVLIARTNKHLHLRLGPNVRDIWLSGIRGAEMPIDAKWPALAGEIAYQNLRVLRREGQNQSLSRIRIAFDDDNVAPQEAGVFFAFKE
jgi:hypothetical protein